MASGDNGVDAINLTTLAPTPLAVIAPGSAVYKFLVGGVADSVLYCFGGGDNGNPNQGNVFNNVQIYQP